MARASINLRIKSGDGEVAASLFAVDQARQAVLFLHGWRSSQLSPQTLVGASRSMRALRKFSGPVLLVSSSRDELIHTDTIDAYRKAADASGVCEFRTIDATHALDDASRLRYLEVLIPWLRGQA